MLFPVGARCALAILLAAPLASAAETSAAPAAAVAPSLAGAAVETAKATAAATVSAEDQADVQPLPAPGDTEDADEPSEAAAAAKQAVLDPALRYSRDLSDDELTRLWRETPDELGSVSVGFADQGRLLNAVHLEDGDAWTVARRDLAWGTQETIESLVTAFRAVRKLFPGARARLSHIGLQTGGWLRPHKSHQSGRDADLGFFYKGDGRPGGRLKNIVKAFDLPRNWALIKALITQSDVQIVWVDRGIQKILRDHALKTGEDKAWVDRIFRAGKDSLLQHARRHHDHFHVRFYAPRSQELGRRLQPLLALRPEHNVTLHKVKPGQTLGHVAKAYGLSVQALMRANHLKRTFLAASQRLLVPLRKPCTKCPLPPPVEVPPRCLPPEPAWGQAAVSAGGAGKSAALAQ